MALLGMSGFLLARASQHPGIVAISGAVVAVRAFSVGRGVFRYAERLVSHDTAFRVLASARVRVYERLARLAPAGLGAFRSGDLLARLVSDVDDTQDLFIRGVAPPLAAAVAGAGAVTACLLLRAPAAGVLAAGLLAAGAAVPWLAAARARAAVSHTAAARGALAASLTDLIGGAADLHACGGEEPALAAVAAADGILTRLARRAAAADALGAGLGSAVAGLTVWGVLLLGEAAVAGGTLTRVPLAVLTLTALAAFEAVSALPAAAVRLGHARTGAARLAAVLATPDPVSDPPDPLPRPVGPVTASLRGAAVRYRPGEPLALDGVDLDLQPGRRVALVGPSGAGKSTVAAVLLRFCELTDGSATLGGADLDRYRAGDVRAVIGGCPQDPHVFDATLRENVLLARPAATAADVDAAAGRAGLLGWVRSLPLGWDTPVSAHGAVMSGGERQRLALTRALLADPAILILDEPAAHLDPGARRALTADLLAVTRGRTVLLITHELDGLDQVDEIAVLVAGKVMQRGTHRELLRAGGWYRRMWAAAEPAGLPG